jgi:uncharacterized membrane protein
VADHRTIPERTETAPSRDAQMDALVGYLLLSGVSLSVALVALGLLWHFLRTGTFQLAYPIGGMNLFEFLLAEIRIAGQGRVRPRTLVDAGIAVLLLTPYLRVLASMLYFLFVQRNWKYSLFTAVVLGVLTFSLFLR